MLGNPFKPTRFELEKQPVIWLSSRARSFLASIKSVYINGSRGSGKTTLLRSLSTYQTLIDKSLRAQHSKSALKWYGLYLQFNKHFPNRVDRLTEALASEQNHEEAAEFSFFLYFETSLLYQFFNEISELKKAGRVRTASKQERIASQELESLFRKVSWLSSVSIENFEDARRLMRDIQDMFYRSRRRFDVDKIQELSDAFPPGRLISLIRMEFIPALRGDGLSGDGQKDFTILLDDCEMLTTQQQVFLNTYIRTTAGTAKWIICYLSERYNSTGTLLNNTSLTADDREIVSLNEITESEFSEFCNRITNMRLEVFLQQFEGEHVSPKYQPFVIEQAFGSMSYNSLVEEVLRESQNRKLEGFRDRVLNTRDRLQRQIKKSLHEMFSCNSGKMPYVEHIVLNALNIDIKKYGLPEEQRSLAKTIDGKQAAAYIAFCAEYNLQPVYSGSNIVKAISDRCIRDYLDLMGTFFEHFMSKRRQSKSSRDNYRKAALGFLSSQGVPWRDQNLAIKSVSSIKNQDAEFLRKAEPGVARVVFALAHLQRLLEHDTKDSLSVRLPSRGRFRVELPKAVSITGQINLEISDEIDGSERLKDVLEKLEYDRFIKFIAIEESEHFRYYTFSLHRRMRPHYRCGHTGPYPPDIDLGARALSEIVYADDDFKEENWAKDRYDQIRSRYSVDALAQPELPL